MHFFHAGIDYGPEITDGEGLLKESFVLASSEYILPFNPVVTDTKAPIVAAFFGLNAYSNDNDFSLAKRERNFAEWCQGSYNQKIFRVMSLWADGLSFAHSPVGLYYSNFVKLVLHEDNFYRAIDVDAILKKYENCLRFFEEITRRELNRLKSQGCQLFICFGWSAYSYMEAAAKSEKINLIRERHFSRYSVAYTRYLINKHCGRRLG